MKTTKRRRCSGTGSRSSVSRARERAIASLISLLSDPSAESVNRAEADSAEYFEKLGETPNPRAVDALASLARRTAPGADPHCFFDEYLARARELLESSPRILAIRTLLTPSAEPIPTAVLRWKARNRGATSAGRAYLADAVPAIVSLDRLLLRRFTPGSIDDATGGRIIAAAVGDGSVARFLGVNTYDGRRWFNRERYGDLVQWLAILMALYSLAAGSYEADSAAIVEIVRAFTSARNESGYSVDELVRLLQTARP